MDQFTSHVRPSFHKSRCLPGRYPCHSRKRIRAVGSHTNIRIFREVGFAHHPPANGHLPPPGLLGGDQKQKPVPVGCILVGTSDVDRSFCSSSEKGGDVLPGFSSSEGECRWYFRLWEGVVYDTLVSHLGKGDGRFLARPRFVPCLNCC